MVAMLYENLQLIYVAHLKVLKCYMLHAAVVSDYFNLDQICVYIGCISGFVFFRIPMYIIWCSVSKNMFFNHVTAEKRFS